MGRTVQMAYVRIEMLSGRSEEQKAMIARAVTDALQEHAGIAPARLFIVFEDVAAENWASDGALVSAKRRASTSKI